MSEAGSGGKQRSLRNVRKVDLVRHRINSFDSKDCMTQSGAAGVDEKMMRELQKRGDIKILPMGPTKVCIYRQNRGGIIGNTQNLPNLINDICKLSFASTLGEQTIPVPVGSIKFESHSCGHTNTCLRAVQGRCLSTHPQLSEGTRFDMGNVEKKDDQFAEAVANGLNWCVLESHVLREYPQMRIIQKLLCGTVCPQCDDGFCGEPEDHPDGLHLCDNPACRYAKEHF
jgi:hypothetical protein